MTYESSMKWPSAPEGPSAKKFLKKKRAKSADFIKSNSQVAESVSDSDNVCFDQLELGLENILALLDGSELEEHEQSVQDMRAMPIFSVQQFMQLLEREHAQSNQDLAVKPQSSNRDATFSQAHK